MNSQPVMVLMSAIEYRPDLNPRDKLSTDLIADYVVDLRNGKTFPPIHVHRGKAVLFDGAHRFEGYKAHYGDNWREEKIPVIWRDDLPDPDEHAILFKAEAAMVNGLHGLRLSRWERRATLAEIARKMGEEAMLKYAPMFSETTESAKALVASLVTMPLQKAYEQRTELQAVSGGTTSVEPRTPGFGRFRPETIPTGHLQAVEPVIKSACRRLYRVLDASGGDLTEADLRELTTIYQRIGGILGETGTTGL